MEEAENSPAKVPVIIRQAEQMSSASSQIFFFHPRLKRTPGQPPGITHRPRKNPPVIIGLPAQPVLPSQPIDVPGQRARRGTYYRVNTPTQIRTRRPVAAGAAPLKRLAAGGRQRTAAGQQLQGGITWRMPAGPGSRHGPGGIGLQRAWHAPRRAVGRQAPSGDRTTRIKLAKANNGDGMAAHRPPLAGSTAAAPSKGREAVV